MKVLLDAYWWVSGPPSGRNVVQAMVATWAQRHPQDELVVKVRARDVERVQADLVALGIPEVQVTTYSRLLVIHALAAMTLGAGARGYDAVISQNFTPILARANVGVLVYDALFVAHPNWFTLSERLYLALIRPLLRRAHVVFTISESENQRIGQVWPEISSRCVVAGLGVPLGLQTAQPIVPAGKPPKGAPYFLSVGRLNVRKNLARLIQAFEIFSETNTTHQLVIVGQPDGAAEHLGLPESVAKRIHFMGYVSDSELRWLYDKTDLFVCPSLDEGLGLPLLEANYGAAKIIASDIPVFRELDLAVDYFDPFSPTSIAASLRTGLERPALARTSHTYTWIRTVETMRSTVSQSWPRKGDGI